MFEIKNILDPNETIIWSGEPDRKPLLPLPMSGIPIALIFLFVVVSILLWIGGPILYSGSILAIFIAILFIIISSRYMRGNPNAKYMITNRRLIIKSGVAKQDVWFVDLDEIKDALVKIGFFDMLYGTGKLYLITSENPHDPSKQQPLYDPFMVWKQLDESYNHPHLEGLKEPYVVQKLLKELIFGAGTNYVSCKFCYYRYDLNKQEKCPHCSGKQTNPR